MIFAPKRTVAELVASLGTCPDCGAIEATRLCSVIGWRIADGRAESVEIGARLSCQRCGLCYSVGPRGPFKHHPRAIPFTPGSPPPQSPPTAQQPPRDEGEPDRFVAKPQSVFREVKERPAP